MSILRDAGWSQKILRDTGFALIFTWDPGSVPPHRGPLKVLATLHLENVSIYFTESTCWWNFMMIVKNEQTNVNSVHGHIRICSGDVWFWCKHTYWEVKASIPLNCWVYYISFHVKRHTTAGIRSCDMWHVGRANSFWMDACSKGKSSATVTWTKDITELPLASNQWSYHIKTVPIAVKKCEAT